MSGLRAQQQIAAARSENIEQTNRRLARFFELFNYTLNSMRLLEYVGYPFSFDSKAYSELVSDTLSKISEKRLVQLDPLGREVYEYPRIRIATGLTQNDSNGKMVPVTFISHPESFEIEVDVERLQRQLDANPISSVFATLFHEVLVLHRIEGSMSYPISNEFAVGARALLLDENGNFDLWLSKSGKFASPENCSEGTQYYKNIFESSRMLYKNVVSAGDPRLPVGRIGLKVGRCAFREVR